MDANGYYRKPDGSWDYEANNYHDFTKYKSALDDPQWQDEVERRWRKLRKRREKEAEEKADREAAPFRRALEQTGFGGFGRGRAAVVADEGYDLVALTGRQLMAKAIPPREVLMHENGQPLYYAQSRNQTIAWRGVGKTMYGLAQAGALCTGGKVLDFQASRPCRVLYLDGELPEAQLQERIGQMIPAAGLDNFKVINAEFVTGATKGINLLTTRAFESLLREIDKFKPDALFLDSRVMLFPGKQLDEAHLCAVEERMQTLRLRKLCIIESHHLGKNGQQRGLSNNDDALDVQIKLDKVEGWEAGMGLQFRLQYEKVRHQAQLDSGYAVELVGNEWRRMLDTTEAQVVALHKDGKTLVEIGKAIDKNKSTVSRILARWKAREARKATALAPEVGW
jgi:putative DNA primase/helicase